MNNTKEYQAGYEQCMKDVEENLAESIERYNGCKTPNDAWQVVNAIAYFTHEQHIKIREAKNTHDILVFVFEN